eukprot:3324071-Pleurochrysis_carterae.AAC.2
MSSHSFSRDACDLKRFVRLLSELLGTDKRGMPILRIEQVAETVGWTRKRTEGGGHKPHSNPVIINCRAVLRGSSFATGHQQAVSHERGSAISRMVSDEQRRAHLESGDELGRDLGDEGGEAVRPAHDDRRENLGGRATHLRTRVYGVGRARACG